IPATSGELTLVPHRSIQPPSVESNTDTGVAQAATAATSLSVRPLQPVSVCQEGLGWMLQPLPVPTPSPRSPQTFPSKPRGFFEWRSAVPPIAATVGSAAGKLGEAEKTSSLS